MRALVLALLTTACGRISFDASGDAGGSGSDDVSSDTLGACAIRQIAVGERHVCALRNDSAIFCAGDDAEAQLGRGTQGGMSTTAVEATELERAPASAVMSIAAGRQFTCVVTVDGAVKCVGDNADHQLGANTAGQVSATLVTAAAPPLRLVTLGNSFGCGLSPLDELFCWGDTDEGQGGTGSQADAHLPEFVTVGTYNGTSISAGTDHACLVDEANNTWCWGAGTLFRLGVPPTQTCTMATAGPTPCMTTPTSTGMTTSMRVSSGHEHSCVLSNGAGTVACWGSNDQSQCGATASTQTTLVVVPGLSGVRDLQAGRHHTCAIDASGGVSCWGSATVLEVGHAGADAVQPVAVTLPAPALDVVGHPMSRTTCAVLDDGTASCWGANDFGQLGRGMQSAAELPAPFVIPCP